jgi:hypothetical protein
MNKYELLTPSDIRQEIVWFGNCLEKNVNEVKGTLLREKTRQRSSGRMQYFPDKMKLNFYDL